jgi:homoserine kinase
MAGIRVIAPASSANLGPGYDVLSMALDGLHDLLEVSVEEGSGISLEVKGTYAGEVPEDPARNSVGVAASELLRVSGIRAHVHVVLHKEIPPSSGLGSSGAGAAGVVWALNRMLGLNIDKGSLVEIAGSGERAAAGAVHYDNVAASLLGWFNIVRPGSPPRVVTVRPPEGASIHVALAVPIGPRAGGKTRAARALVPHEVPIESVVWNLASVAMIVAGAARGDAALMGTGMSDLIVEPARSSMVPGYSRVRRAAMEAGALGVAISGAGPSMIALTGDAEAAGRVARAMAEAMEAEGTAAVGIPSRPGPGCREARDSV